MNNNDERDYAEERANEELTAEEETAEILADPETMAAIKEGLEELHRAADDGWDVDMVRPHAGLVWDEIQQRYIR